MKILNLFFTFLFVVLVSGELAARCGCSAPRPTKPTKPAVNQRR